MGPMRVLAILIGTLFLALPTAFALECGESSDLEMDAYRGLLDEGDRACLEQAVAGTDQLARVEASFVLIVDAYVSGDKGRYGDLMKRHLTTLHTTDAEVAYLYATHLWREGLSTDEVLKWARVAMDNRRRWLHNRANYDRMVKALYDLMVQVSMERAIEVEGMYQEMPTQINRERADAYKRQARYYLIIAAPCLHYGDCGPYFEVEVEGWAECDDLVQMETLARRGQVTDEHMACLRAKYRRPQAPKQRVLSVMMDQADTDADGHAWEELLAWHWNLTGMDDPLMAYRYAEFLVDHGAAETEEALKWAQVALNSEDGFTGRTGRQALERLHELRVETARQLVVQAEGKFQNDPNAYHTKGLDEARAALARAESERQKYCAANKCRE